MLLQKKWGISMDNENHPLIFERSKEGRYGYSLPELDVPEVNLEEVIEEIYS